MPDPTLLILFRIDSHLEFLVKVVFNHILQLILIVFHQFMNDSLFLPEDLLGLLIISSRP